MMRSLSVAGLLACLLTAGCQPDIAPRPGLGDPIPPPYNDPQIAVLSPALQPWIRFHSAIITDEEGVPLQVEVPVRNLTDRLYLIDYRFIFFDRRGRELESFGWQMQELRPKQTVRLKANALSTDAMDYRLEIKWAR